MRMKDNTFAHATREVRNLLESYVHMFGERFSAEQQDAMDEMCEMLMRAQQDVERHMKE